MKQPKNAENVTVPYNYEPGWNVVIYDSENYQSDQLYAGLCNSEVLHKDDCDIIPEIVSSQGFLNVPFYYEKKKAENLQEKLKEQKIHSEIVYTKINEFNIEKLKCFMLDKIANNFNTVEELEKSEIE